LKFILCLNYVFGFSLNDNTAFEIATRCAKNITKCILAQGLSNVEIIQRLQFNNSWRRHCSNKQVNHLVGQNPSYKNRTSVSTEKLKTGDVSLKITKVRLSDEGTYRCFIPGLNANFSVELVVGNPGVLECKSKGWYPEPEVFWLENKGKIISAGSKEMLRGPDDLYVLSSRLTLEKGHSNNITCRIQQNNQYREAKIHVPVREKTQRKTQRKIATQKPVLSLQIQKSVQQTKRSLAKVSPQWKKISQEKVQQKIRVNNKNCPQKKEK
uniref:Ig-like domain-containing protein n=1 Tax=Neolamprologus brichardi TaxID=32507 RepID=A0A3Q4HMA2_NEOBR